MRVEKQNVLEVIKYDYLNSGLSKEDYLKNLICREDLEYMDNVLILGKDILENEMFIDLVEDSLEDGENCVEELILTEDLILEIELYI